MQDFNQGGHLNLQHTENQLACCVISTEEVACETIRFFRRQLKKLYLNGNIAVSHFCTIQIMVCLRWVKTFCV